MSKLLDSGGYGCVYYPGIDCNGKEINESMVSKIVNDRSAQREINNGKLVKKIKNYKDYFLPVENYCNVTKRLPIKKCTVLKGISNYKIMYVPYKKSKPNHLEFKDLYHSLLTSIQLLIKHKIVHFDIKHDNVIIADKVYILDFGISISIKSVYKHFDDAFYSYCNKCYRWPLEVHILCFLNNKGPIAPDNLKKICTDFVNYNIILQQTNTEFRENYITNSIDYYSDLFHRLSIKEIVRLCIQSWKTWDNYATIIYLFEEGYAISDYFLKAIHYLPKERPTVQQCLAATRPS